MRVAALLLAVLWLGAVPVAAEWKEAHKEGVAALEAGRWAEAERFFRAAVGERTQEKVSRLLKTTYLPHYYLGVALAEQGDCRGALASWATSRKQGAIQKAKSKADDMDRRRLECQSSLRRIDAARTEVRQLLDKVTEASAALAALGRTPELAPLWNQGDPSFGARQEAAEKSLREARRRFEGGGRSPDLASLEAAKNRAREALERIEKISLAARQRLGELNAATASALERLEKTEQRAARTLRSIADLAPYPKTLGSRVSAVEKKLRQVADVKPTAGPKVLNDLTDELTGALAALRRAARRPPESLAEAAEAYLAGRFEEALENLADERLATDTRAAGHVCLLKAASRHALWLLGGERDEMLHDEAVADLARCAEGDVATPPPSPRFFSPRFLDFHRATLEALAESAIADGESPAVGDGTGSGER